MDLEGLGVAGRLGLARLGLGLSSSKGPGQTLGQLLEIGPLVRAANELGQVGRPLVPSGPALLQIAHQSTLGLLAPVLLDNLALLSPESDLDHLLFLWDLFAPGLGTSGFFWSSF